MMNLANRLLHSLKRAGRLIRRQTIYYLLHFIEGDHSWGGARVVGFSLVVMLFWFVQRLFEQDAHAPLDPATLEASFGPLYPLVDFFLSFFSVQVLRHIIPPIAGALIALYFGARYLQNLLELPDWQLAARFLWANLFGGPYPRMVVKDGKASATPAESNPMLKIGGPGWVDIYLGSAAMFERGIGPSSVLGAGTHFVRRFEMLREAFDLREVERRRTDIPVFTKDGLPLILTDVQARFRLRVRGQRTEANPYPVWTHSIRQAVYTPSRRLTTKGFEEWPDVVMSAVIGVVVAWIARRRMDELVPPPSDNEQPDATRPLPYRQVLHELFRNRDNRQKLADMGAELIFVAIGHLRPDPNIDPTTVNIEDATGQDKIHQQFIETWRVVHQAMASDEIASAQGYAKYLDDTARAQEQAALIQAVTEGLNEARTAGLPMSDLVTARMMEYIANLQANEDTARLLRG